MTAPMDIFDQMRARAVIMAKTAFMESDKPWPGDDDPVVVGLIMPMLGIGIAAAAEHIAHHPEHIAMLHAPICTECREPVQTLQVGVEGPDADGLPARVAWPCGHRQS